MTVKPYSRLNYAPRNYNVISATMVPVYNVSASSSSINEGTTVTYTITTQYILDGTVLYWTTSGTTVAADFTDGLTSGSVTMTNNTATVTRTLVSDITTEGAETIVFELRTGSTSGTIVASTPSGTVNDTSVLTITPDVSSMNEGATVTWTINAIGFGTGTLYYTNSGTTGASDFTDGLNSGSIAITADSGTLTKTLINDLSTEGSETIIIQIRTGSTSGTIVGTSSTVTVADTSISSQAYSVKFASSQSISTASSSNFVFAGDFTIEAWVNMPTTASGGPYSIYSQTDGSTGFDFRYYSNNFQISFNAGSGTNISGTGSSLTPNVWYHVAAVRSGSTITVYVNGKALGTTTNNSSLGYASRAAFVGAYNTSGTNQFIGSISNLRVVNGTAVYTANFNPPTDNLSNIANTKLLINGSSIADASGNNSLTTNGTPIVTMENPFGDGSILLNGSSQYLTIPSNAIFALPGDFTIEGWYYFNATPGTSTTSFTGLDQAGTGGVGYDFSTTGVGLFASNVGYQASFTYTWLTGVWYHIAFVRSGTTVNCYVNGIALTPVTGVSYSWAQSGIVTIGKNGGVSQQYFNGYISNFRIVKGTAVYTANFTPSTNALTAISNTTLLTFQYQELYDASTNKLAITNNGSALQSNQNPFGNYYSSFNSGSSQYLSVPGNATAFGFGTGDFTIEFWVNPSVLGSARTDFIDMGDSTNTGPLIWWASSQTLQYYQGGALITSAAGALTVNVWQHVALVRSSGSTKMYVNGVQVGSTYSDTKNYTGTGTINIGRNLGGVGYVSGYMSNVRIVKGVAVYTGAFTPPTTPLNKTQSSGTNISAITGTSTSLLTCQYANIVDASTNVLSITNNGSIKTYLSDLFSGIVSGVNYSQKNYSLKILPSSAASTYISGTLPATLSGDFTVECWFNMDYRLGSPPTMNQTSIAATGATVGGAFTIAGNGVSSSTGWCINLWLDGISWVRPGSATNFEFVPSGATYGSRFFLPNTWYHLAICRIGTTWYCYINGVLATNRTATNYSITTTAVVIGDIFAQTQWNFWGYISNFRIVNGLAVYTGAFTPPTSPLKISQSSGTNIAAITTQTSLLTCQYNTLFDASTNKLALTRTNSPDMVNVYPFPT